MSSYLAYGEQVNIPQFRRVILFRGSTIQFLFVTVARTFLGVMCSIIVLYVKRSQTTGNIFTTVIVVQMSCFFTNL